MSELKAHRIDNIFSAYKIGKAFCMKTEEEVYLKSEADKVIAELKESVKNLILDNYLKDKEIRHHKYKRCLAMARECINGEIKLKRVKMRDMNDHQFWQFDNDYWLKWNKRWLELAEKFKETK